MATLRREAPVSAQRSALPLLNLSRVLSHRCDAVHALSTGEQRGVPVALLIAHLQIKLGPLALPLYLDACVVSRPATRVS